MIAADLCNMLTMASFFQLHKHEEALQILTLELNDFVGAELYCVTGGHSIGSATTSKEKDISKPSSSSGKAKRRSEKELPKLPVMTAEETQERRELCLLLLKMYLNISDQYVSFVYGSQSLRMIIITSTYKHYRDLRQFRSVHLLNTQGLYLDLAEVHI